MYGLRQRRRCAFVRQPSKPNKYKTITMNPKELLRAKIALKRAQRTGVGLEKAQKAFMGGADSETADALLRLSAIIQSKKSMKEKKKEIDGIMGGLPDEMKTMIDALMVGMGTRPVDPDPPVETKKSKKRKRKKNKKQKQPETVPTSTGKTRFKFTGHRPDGASWPATFSATTAADQHGCETSSGEPACLGPSESAFREHESDQT